LSQVRGSPDNPHTTPSASQNDPEVIYQEETARHTTDASEAGSISAAISSSHTYDYGQKAGGGGGSALKKSITLNN
jgi:hypothetical protein